MKSELLPRWRALSHNYDRAIAGDATREFLISLNRERFKDLEWRTALVERREEFPKFFEAFDYSWCDEAEHFDFPLETSLQVRTLDAAIGLWLADVAGKPLNLDFDWIVARSTFLANFAEVTPHVQHDTPFKFVVSPLGWLEFIHRYFSEFGQCLEQSVAPSAGMREVCRAGWMGIAANLIASSCNEMDYFIPQMVDAIIQHDESFSNAQGDFRITRQTDLAADLAYASHDFALCHEVAHIAAEDYQEPDEDRADEWGLAAYFGSWGRRPALHLHIGMSNATRAAVGPIVFGSAIRSLLAARGIICKRLQEAGSPVRIGPRQYSDFAQRSRSLLLKTVAARNHHASFETDDEATAAWQQFEALFKNLADYEIAFGEFIGALNSETCWRARGIAIDAERSAIQEAVETSDPMFN